MEAEYILAYHDRSDGGLFTTLVEMSFTGHVGIDIQLPEITRLPDSDDITGLLFNEELGAVLQVALVNVESVIAKFAEHGLTDIVHRIGRLNKRDRINISWRGNLVIDEPRSDLQQTWAETSYRLQGLRDNPECAEQEFERIVLDDPGLSLSASFDLNEDIAAPFIATGVRPRLAILREQGVNGQLEMAAAFDRAGFTAVDVHMSDIIAGRTDLSDFKGLAACGGFSYGDVLGAGEGWAKTILYNSQVRDMFARFFERPDSFSLGVCNGCQMLSNLKSLIPGAEIWPHFVRNASEQFEARVALIKIESSPSVLLQGMEGSYLPIAVAHGEGRAEFGDDGGAKDGPAALDQSGLATMRYADNSRQVTEDYPANPNGSPGGLAGLTTPDGRVTIMMPHPERVFRSVTNSWYPRDSKEDGAWLRLFRNARIYIQ